MSIERTTRNLANAQHSTGPNTILGKLRSSQNAFRHGLYSKQLILPNEDPAEFDHLRATLRQEHCPASTTEEILVDELAQHFWRMRRFRELEARAFQQENLDAWLENGLAPLIQRSLASAERSFHRTLAALSRLQAARSAPQPKPLNSSLPDSLSEDFGADDSDLDDDLDAGFVPQDSLDSLLEPDQDNHRELRSHSLASGTPHPFVHLPGASRPSDINF